MGDGLVRFFFGRCSALAQQPSVPSEAPPLCSSPFADDHLPEEEEGEEEEVTSIQPAITTPTIRQQFLTLYCDLVHRTAIHNCFLSDPLDRHIVIKVSHKVILN